MYNEKVNKLLNIIREEDEEIEKTKSRRRRV